MVNEQTPSVGSKPDASNPFFIHHSDHPGMMLVSKPIYRDNYATWHRSMTVSLSAKNKLGFVDGTVKASSAKTQPDDYASWRRCKDMILSWLINSLQPDIADSVIYSIIAHKIWEDLHERFSQSNGPRIFQTQWDIASLTYDQLSVAAYYTKLKSLWDELASNSDSTSCTCGAKNERHKLMQFLMGLNESYNVICGKILLMNLLPTVRQANASISQEEKQRYLSDGRGISEAAAMAVRHDQKPRTSNRPPPHSFYCDQDHHTRDICYKLNDYPPGQHLHKSHTRGGNQNCDGNRSKRDEGSFSLVNLVSDSPSLQDI